MSETETPAERVKPSKLRRIKDGAIMTAWIAIPVAVTGAAMYVSVKTSKINLETAKLKLETAKLNKS